MSDYTQDYIVQLKLQKLAMLEQKIKEEEELPHRHIFKHYPWSREFFDDNKTRIQIVCAANQVSKAVDDETLIPTPNGFFKIKDLKIGDYVFGRDGKKTKIIDVPFIGEDECYRITFDDGATIVASKDHKWIAKTARERFRKDYTTRSRLTGKIVRRTPNPHYLQWREFSTSDLVESGGFNPKPKQRPVIPLCDPIEMPNKNLFDPYLVGLLLGNGSMVSGSVMLSSCEEEIHDYLLSNGYDLGFHVGKLSENKVDIRIRGIKEKIKEIGLWGHYSYEKFIPIEYMNGSYTERKELLQGLMDTDGEAGPRGRYSYSTSSERLKDNIVELVNSLGGKIESIYYKEVTFYKKNGVRVPCRPSWRIQIKTPFNPFRLKRKADKWHVIRYAHERIIYKIEPVGVQKCRCITVDNNDGSFLAGKEYIVTHNSSAQIRKTIELACNKDLWSTAFPNVKNGLIPNLFFYFYPDLKLATTEWHFKWKQFMPKCKDDPEWGWSEVFDARKMISEIRFNSGVTIQFKGYSQDAISLQASTPHYIGVDEECPWHLMPEIMARLNASNGMLSCVFTATIGQEEWERIVEKRTLWPEARVWQVSLFDCMYYEDGTASHFTEASIKQVISRCATEKDVLMRVYGRFVKSDRLVYQNFTSENRCDISELAEIKSNWPKFAGIDYGGGGTSHPSAIVFIAVHPDFTSGYVYKCWRGDDVVTTANDVLMRYVEMKEDDNVWFAFYDWAAKDLGTIAERSGLALIRAEKSHDIGEGVLNSLFKNKMLKIPLGGEFDKLASELNNLSIDTPKTKAKDDLGDSLRYSASKVPWVYKPLEAPEEKKSKTEQDIRREAFLPQKDHDGLTSTEDEIEFWSDLLA